MNILYINTYDPATEQHGGAAVTRSELKALQSMANVRTLFGAPLPVRRHQLSYTRLILEILGGSSLKVASYRVLHRPAMFYGDFDIIWCNHDFSAYDHETFEALGIPYIVRKHNAEHQLIKPTSAMRRIERGRIARFEDRVARSAAATLHISSSECIADSGSRRKSWLPPLLEDPLQFAGKTMSYDWSTRPVDLLCVSNFNWPPNKEGIEWFLSEVLDRLPASCCLHLVGAGSERYQREGRIFGHGFVPDLSHMLGSAKLFVAPVLSGAGVKIKNVTAMAAGLPLLTTTCGMEGIQAPGAAPVACVADGPDRFACEVIRLLADEAACAKMSRRSIAWAQAHLISTEAWCEKVRDAIELALS